MTLDINAVYQQDGEFCRYQDRLRWSRYQTAAVIEAGIAYAVWGTGADGIGYYSTLAVCFAGTLLIVAVCWLAQIDERDYSRHLKRIMQFENTIPNARLQKPKVRWVLCKG